MQIAIGIRIGLCVVPCIEFVRTWWWKRSDNGSLNMQSKERREMLIGSETTEREG